MNKNSLIFRVVSIILLVINLISILFFAYEFGMVLENRIVLKQIHFWLFISAVLINIIYIIYLSMVLIRDKITKNTLS